MLGAPAAILISLIMVPETGDKRTERAARHRSRSPPARMDAIVKGTAAGLELLLNICAMLIVLVALVHLANAIIGVLPHDRRRADHAAAAARLSRWRRCAG